MSTATTARTATAAETLRYAMGSGERPAGVCPTLGTALRELTVQTQPFLPGDMSAVQLGEMLDDSDGGDEVTARRMWRIASHLAGDVVPRWMRYLGPIAPTVAPYPPLKDAAATAEVLEQLTRATHQLPPVRRMSTGTVRGAMRTAGIAALLRAAATDPVLVPLATAVAAAGGELLARAAGALIPEEAHQRALAEHPLTVALVRDLPDITTPETR